LLSRHRRARNLHPGAWWLWAIGLAGAASRTTNPILLATLIAVAGFVVSARRSNAPWSMAYRAALVVGAFALVVHLVIEAVFGPPIPGTVLVTLPQLQLPSTFAGVRVGGPVTAEAMLGASYLGLQLAAILAALGAANALASPTRLLKSLPGAVYELGVAVVVALTVVPDSLAQLHAVRRARRLRGREDQGIRGVAASVGPVLHSALERSLGLAAAMDSRGYGRRRAVPRGQRRFTAGLVLTGMLGVLLGVYALLDAALSTASGLTVIALASAVALAMVAVIALGTHRIFQPKELVAGLYLYEYLGPPVILLSLSVFVFFQALDTQRSASPDRRVDRALASLCDASLGIYVIHPLFLEALRRAGLDHSFDPVVVGLLLRWGLTVALSWLAVSLLARVPVLRRTVQG